MFESFSLYPPPTQLYPLLKKISFERWYTHIYDNYAFVMGGSAMKRNPPPPKKKNKMLDDYPLFNLYLPHDSSWDTLSVPSKTHGAEFCDAIVLWT